MKIADEAMERDAERYRRIRRMMLANHRFTRDGIVYGFTIVVQSRLTPASLDEAVDTLFQSFGGS